MDEKTISLIVNSVIYFAKADQFNDPFDCRFRYDLTGSEAEWRDLFEDLLTQVQPELSREQVASMVDAKMEEGAFRDSRFLDSVSKDALRHQNERLGILCLTADPTNILMWSHYADNHRGCCLEFSTDAPLFKRAEPIRYAAKYPRVRYLDCRGKPDIHAELTTLTKSKLWKYEKEWRVTSPDGAGLYKFDKCALTGIICGHWMTAENVDLLKRLIQDRKPKVQLRRATANDRRFALKLLPVE